MSTLIVHRNGTNGARPPAPARVLSPLGGTQERALAPIRHKVDQLAELRALLKQAEEAERAMTAEVLAALRQAGLSRLEGYRVAAVVGERRILEVDAELFLHATGSAGYAALTVRVEAARRLMPADLLEAISESTTTPVLRVEPVSPSKASA